MKRKTYLLNLLLSIITIFSLSFFKIVAQSPCDLDGGIQATVVNIDNDEIIVQHPPNGITSRKAGAVSYISEYECKDFLADLPDLLNATFIKPIRSINSSVWKIDFPVVIDNLTLSNVWEVVNYLNDHECIPFAQPNFLYHLDAVPNDPDFSEQNYLQGSSIGHIGAPDAWDITTGNSNQVVGILDSGIDYNHEDLTGNIWINPGEIPNNGIDDDGNYYIDDYMGWDFANEVPMPYDSIGHGTLVAGIIGAVGNNGVGITGINWRVKLMALKCFNNDSIGKTADIINALAYSLDKGVKLTNNSWGGEACDSLLKAAIINAHNQGQLFVISAGNQVISDANNTANYTNMSTSKLVGPVTDIDDSMSTPDINNNDANDYFPANFEIPNIFSVMSSDSEDAPNSKYGQFNVDIAAPGNSVYSTYPDDLYAWSTGSSMATAHVTGVAALLWSAEPTLSHLEVKDKIICRADYTSSLSNKCVADGRLDAANLLNFASQISITSDQDCAPGNYDMIFDTHSPLANESFIWSFDDGSSSTNETPTYLAYGDENICVEITDACGEEELICQTVSTDLEITTGDIVYSTGLFNAQICQMYLCGGNPPFNYQWSTAGYVRSSVIEYNYLAVNYGTTSIWSVTVTDQDGDQWFYSHNGSNKTEEDHDLIHSNENIQRVYPNPFTDQLSIDYKVKKEGSVYISLFDTQGKMIERLLALNHQEAGSYQQYFDTSHLTKGVYFLQVNTPDGQSNKKILRL